MSRNEPNRKPLIGLVFVVILTALLAAAVIDYNGGFTKRTRVTLTVPNAGNQLGLGAPVKLHGAIVGEVDRIEAVPNGARLTLALDPEATRLIPKNTQARILPKTLVGQNYVDLELPSSPSSQTVVAGDVIERDASAKTVELETALDSLLEVIDTVPPEQIATTLNSMATAFEGRGEQFGDTLVTLHNYLDEFNPSLPQFNQDLRALATVSRTYSRTTPDLLKAFDNLSTTARTINEQQSSFDRTYSDLGDSADDLREFLDDNGDNIIELTDVSRVTLATLKFYSPEFPCLLQQLAGLVPRVNKIFGEGESRPSLRVLVSVTNGRGKYEPNRDEPQYLDTRGPKCYPIVRIAPQYADGVPFKDGSVPPEGSLAAALREESAARTARSVKDPVAGQFDGRDGVLPAPLLPNLSGMLDGVVRRGAR